MSDTAPVELTEEYVADHTDMHLGTVVLHAAQVRVVLHQNVGMKKLLHDIRVMLRVQEATRSDVSDYIERIKHFVGDSTP